MRQAVAFLCLTLAASLRGQTLRSLDQPIDWFTMPKQLPPCGMKSILSRLAKESGASMGLELEPECFPGLYGGPRIEPHADDDVLVHVSVRQALDAFAHRFPQYRWRDMEGIAVMRPTTAWDDANDVLSLRADAFQFTEGRLMDGVNALLHYPTLTSSFRATPADRSFPIIFSGGTVLEALNALSREHGSASWIAAVTSYKTQPRQLLHLGFFTADASGFSGFSKPAFLDELKEAPSRSNQPPRSHASLVIPY